MTDEQLEVMRNDQIKGIIDRLAQCVDKIGDIQAKQAATSDRLAMHLDAMEKLENKIEKLGSRLTDLEKWLYKGIGFVAAIVVAFEVFKTLR
jgi:peptidoglycan hydrolase CwlO-like protein